MTRDRSAADPLAPLQAKGAKDREDLVRAAGGALSADDVARRLGVSREVVGDRVREKKLLAVPLDGEDRYPAVQFAEHGVVSGLPAVLTVIGLDGAWSVLDFLMTPDDALEGLSPIEALKTRPDLRETVLELARAEGRHGA